MAYDATKKRQPGEASMGQPTDPYASLLEPAQTPGTSAAPLQGSGGASPTGYVNFGDYFNANADAAANGAQQLQTSAGQKGQNAQAELGKAQSAFTGAVQSGTPQGPTGADFQRAQSGSAPTTVDAAAPARTSADTQTAPAGATKTTTQPGEQSQDAWRQQMQQGWNKAYAGYQGPNALSNTSAYDQLLKDTTASSDEANALASGNSGIAGALQGSANTQADAALLGAAGRQGFSSIGQKYGGGLNRLTAADAASQQQSTNAKQQSQAAYDQYGLLAKDDAATQAAQADAAKQAGATSATPDTWTPEEEQAYQQALSKGYDQAQNNGNAVLTNLADQNQTFGSSSEQGTNGKGWGFFGGADGGPGEQIGINEFLNADGSPDTSGWWGGAGGPTVGDASLPAETWYALASMSPEERAKWWAHNHPGGS